MERGVPYLLEVIKLIGKNPCKIRNYIPRGSAMTSVAAEFDERGLFFYSSGF